MSDVQILHSREFSTLHQTTVLRVFGEYYDSGVWHIISQDITQTSLWGQQRGQNCLHPCRHITVMSEQGQMAASSLALQKPLDSLCPFSSHSQLNGSEVPETASSLPADQSLERGSAGRLCPFLLPISWLVEKGCTDSPMVPKSLGSLCSLSL